MVVFFTSYFYVFVTYQSMSHKPYIPAFYSSDRLAELAKFVADTDKIDKTTVDKPGDVPRESQIEQVAPTLTNIMKPNIDAVSTITQEEISSDTIDEIVPNIDTVDKEGSNNISISNDKPSYQDDPVTFTASSAGFHCGNFSEFKLDNKVFLPKHNSKRGITVLYLVNDLKRFHAWNFDFYKSSTKIATNRNFISVLRRLPGDTYFAMSIKDDAYRNLFEGTKNFLARILGCKSIWRLNYRNSWCAIVYKKTEKSFEVVAESHNPGGVASAQYLINRKRTGLNQSHQLLSQPYPPTYSPSYPQNYPQNYPQQVVLNDTNETTMNPPLQEVEQNKQPIENKTIEKLTEEVQELKKLVLEQTKLITQLVEGKKDE